MASGTGKTKFDVFIDEKYRTLDAKVKWAVVAAAFLVPALLFFFLFFKPQSEKIAALEKQVASATAELNKVKRTARDLPRHKKEFAAIQQQFEAMAVLLPKSQEIPDLLRNISDLGKGAGLDFLTFVPGQETPKDFYAEIPIDITIVGPYHNLGSFLDNVSKLERIVTVNNITMGNPKEDGTEMLLNSSCRLITYRFTNTKVEPKDDKAKAKAARK
jgi:type IV pilus assembly protein PilO